MGVNLKDLVPRRTMLLEELNGRSVAVDAYNALYQFLSIIRQPTGELLTDRQGRVTSHLSGILYRNSNLAEKGVKIVYVFDGKPPSLKSMETERRRRVKEEASIHYKEAIKRGDMEEARMYAQMTSKLKNSMVDDAKRLLTLLGIPWVQAPSEGEAQAAYLTQKGTVWATASQDYDSLLFGAPRLVRNLAITGKRKLPRKNIYVEVTPELIEQELVLNELGVTLEQLIDIGILVGTDFNPDGAHGVGAKTAFKLMKEHGRLEKIVPQLREKGLPEDLSAIKQIFLNPNVSDDYRVEWNPPDIEGTVRFLCGERDFSEERTRNALGKMSRSFQETKAKRTLDRWFS